MESREEMSRIIGNKILEYHEIDSTNSELKRLAALGAPEGTVVTAKLQTIGKGRLGRKWNSDEGGLFISVLLKPSQETQSSEFTLVVSLAVNRVLRQLGFLTYIKWPNDVLLNGKKICGILVESGLEGIIVGIGINVNIRHFDKDLQHKASSLVIEAGTTDYDIKTLRTQLLRELDKLYTEFCINGFVVFRDEYKQYCINLHKEVRFMKGKEQTAKAVDISESGGLVVEDMEGQKQVLYSGEVFISLWDYI